MDLRQVVVERFAASTSVSDRFFEENNGRLADACLAMARRFHAGGRLLAFGTGSAATDAQHVAVEFVHPVITGKRALPAIALTSDVASLSGIAQTAGFEQVFAHQIDVLCGPSDIALGISHAGVCPSVLAALAHAKKRGLLTIGMAGGDDSGLSDSNEVDYAFVVPADDTTVVQEVQETAYHVLWELVHVFFGHKHVLEQE